VRALHAEPGSGKEELAARRQRRRGRAIAAWLTVIKSARLHEVEPFAYDGDVLTKLAAYRDLASERTSSDGEVILRELLPAAWVTRNPDRRLSLAR
jgi:hypothetical protein